MTSNAEQSRHNRQKAFDFQMRQAERIGIETIRTHRIKRYQNDYEQWNNNFDSAATVVPQLICLLLIRVHHG